VAKKLGVDELPAQLRVAPGAEVHLREEHADRTFGLREKDAETELRSIRPQLERLQYELYADGKHALLVVLQAMDGGGKDGTIRNVLSAFNPQGCTVTSFKAPTPEELAHDFLWRVHRHAPRRGEIAVFNRSHYEDVLVVRVRELVPRAQWRVRYRYINEFESLLHSNGVHIVKLFLHISRDEQRRRFEDRLENPRKQWKFSPGDLEVRKQWPAYRRAYEDAISRCSTPEAPWYVVPADHKWFRNLAVARILQATLASLPLRFPIPSFDPKKIRIP
jgi:PPK2 family polyphosphate:nucleotide phosphotransferase